MTAKIPTRDQIAIEHTWNLASLYASLAAWEDDFSLVETSIESLGAAHATIPQSASELSQLLSGYFSAKRRLEKVCCYAAHQHDTDLADQNFLELFGRATTLDAKFSEATSFLEPMILALPGTARTAWMASSELAPYARYLRELLRSEPHTLSASEEKLLASASEALQATERVFSQLNNTDLTFGTVTSHGTPVAVSHGSFTSLLRNPDRDLRSQVWHAYYSPYDAHKNTFAAVLAGSIKSDIFLAKAHRFSSARAAALFPDNVSEQVYDNLIAATRGGIAPLHQYWEVRRQKLDLREQHLYDTYVPVVGKPSREFGYEEACQLIVKACEPLGTEYCSVLRKGFEAERWVDVYESKGKRSGAYSGGCYESFPFILMNYRQDSIDSMFTLAHEAGHSMHSYLTHRNQSYQDSDYSILVAEVASTFNEQLLLKYLREKYADDAQLQRYLLNYEIDSIKATIFRQVMFAEFEQRIHAHAESDGALTLSFFREQYGELLSAYFGPSVKLLPLDTLECFRIPHFYWNFYVYKYATGLAAAIVLADKVWRAEPKAQERYLEFLKSGASVPPIEALKRAGVDLGGPTPVAMALDHFKVLIERFVVALGS